MCHYLSLPPKYFYYPQIKTYIHEAVLLFSLWIYLVWVFHINRIIQHEPFVSGFFHFHSIIILRTHSHCSMYHHYILFMAEKCSILHIYYFLYPFINWWTFGLFVPFSYYECVWTFIYEYLFWVPVFFSSLGHMHRRGIAGSYGSSVLNFVRNCQTFYTAAPFLPAVYEGSDFSTPWLLFVIYCLSLWVLSYISLGF